MKKKKPVKTKPALWLKPALVALLTLLILLLWIGSDNRASTRLAQLLSLNSKAEAQTSDIKEIIKPLLEEPTYTLTFEDELPEPVFSDKSHATVSNVPSFIDDRHELALIIDDVGYSMKAMRRLLELPFTLTVAILPDSPHAEESARMAHQHGLKVMLHMPMQTSNPKYQQKMERFYLHQDMSQEEFTQVFEAALAKVPYAEGVNNHMGSLLTENRQAMTWMMALCKKHHLFFIDSRTSSKSVASIVAKDSFIAWNERDVFLDHSVEPVALQRAWESALSCIEKSDRCIMLAHPHPETLDFLEQHTGGFNTQSFIAVDQALKH